MSAELRKVTADEAEIRLDRWFRRHFPALTQGMIQKLCRTGQVRVDGRRVDAAARLLPGQAIRVPPLALMVRPSLVAEQLPAMLITPETQRSLEQIVLYRDDQLLVLNKPHGLPVQGGPGISRHLDGMLHALSFDGDRPRLVHRLDRDTSGVLVLARTPGTAAKLAEAFRGRAVDKTYWAVVAGRPVPPEGRVDLALQRISGPRGERTALAARNDAAATRAVSDYRTLDHAARKLAWLELKPLTGRTHQLRVHCAALGAPILGDMKYAEPDQNGAGSAIVAGLSSRLHLHARWLVLPHPRGGTLLVEAELPTHMADTFRILGFVAPRAREPQRSA
jgi:23S rRNA pseudouridine955/2504/2580 synthase